MIEILILTAFAFGAGGTIFTIWRNGVTSRRFHVNPELPAPEPTRMSVGPRAPLAISASVREELDSSPRWWDREFHKALKHSGAPVLAEIQGDIIEEKSFSGALTIQYELPGHTVLEGCTCVDCNS